MNSFHDEYNHDQTRTNPFDPLKYNQVADWIQRLSPKTIAGLGGVLMMIFLRSLIRNSPSLSALLLPMRSDESKHRPPAPGIQDRLSATATRFSGPLPTRDLPVPDGRDGYPAGSSQATGGAGPLRPY